MRIISELNRQLLARDQAAENLCAAVSDETAAYLADLACDLPGDEVQKVKRLLDKRAAGKAVVVDGSPEFRRLIADCADENFLPGESRK